MKFKLLFTICLGSLALYTAAQKPMARFQHIDAEDGLSHSLVSSVAEDSLGFIWFGTQDGLNRYDGYGFKTYYKGNSVRHPSDNWIIRLFLDATGQLWIVYNGEGIERFDPVSETFHPYNPDPEDPGSISDNSMVNNSGEMTGVFLDDSQGRLWIGTLGGLNLYHRDSDSFTSFVHDPEDESTLSHNRVAFLYESADQRIWVATARGLNLLDPATGEVTRCAFGREQGISMGDLDIRTMLQTEDGALWIGTESEGVLVVEHPDDPDSRVYQFVNVPINPNHLPSINDLMKTDDAVFVAALHGLYRVTGSNGNYQSTLVPETRGIPCSQLLEDSKGDIWASSDDDPENSLMRISPDLLSVEIFKGDRQNPYMFGGARVSGLLESSTGLLWINTEKHGVYMLDLNARKFGIINNTPGREYYISNNEVYSIFEDRYRQLYVGTKEELNRIDLDLGTTYGFNNYFDLKRNLSYEYSSSLPSRLIGVMEEMPGGKIWMGAFDYKVSLYDPERMRFLNFHLNEQESKAFQLWSMRAICVTNEGQVYFGSANYRMARLGEDGLSFEYFPIVKTGDPSGVNDDHIQYIYEDRSGILWIGTMSGGLNRMDPGTGKFTHILHDPSDPRSISSNRIKCILEPEIVGNDILWVGTQGGGLNRYDRSTGRFTAITMDDGLPSNTIHGILEDKAGNLWLSTNRGLVQFDPLTGRISVFTTDDGISGNEFNEGAFYKNSDGIMYFGGTMGITWFNPEEIREKPEVDAPVVFTGFSVSGNQVLPGDTVNGKVLLDQSIAFTRKMTLSHRERFIGFEFTSLDVGAANKLKYRYMLEGFEQNWNEVDATQRTISYSNIPAGNYSLKVMGSNSDGTQFRQPTILELEIKPPFWKTSFFRFLVMAIILVIFIIIIQIRTRLLENQKKMLAREVEERTHDLKEANHLLEQRNTEIRDMADRLHESDQMKLKFFTNISHEFRTPLTLIMGPTEKLMASKELKEHKEVIKDLELIHRNERRLFKLINQLLEVRRVETGNLELAVAEDDLLQYLKDIHELFRPYAEKKEVEFNFESNVSRLMIPFDADKVEKIFYNLLSNAFKYTPRRGRVEIRCEKIIRDERDWVRITVEDSGPGISEAHLPHIFDRFFMISDKHRSARMSSGIGLSLSKDLVERHHGTIDVHSCNEKGTRFDVFLPASREAYKAEEILEDAEKDLVMEYIPSMLESYDYSTDNDKDNHLEREDTFRILVVEDNPDLQKFLYSEMSHIYEVAVASNGLEALDEVKKKLPDLVISDIMMPEMDGIELCKKIKQSEPSSHVPVILLTAKSSTENQVSGLESGADDYITKPFSLESLKLKVRNQLETRKQLAEKFSAAASYIPENIKISQIDQGFLEKFIKLVEDNIDDTELSGDVLASELGMSKGNLYKKLKSLTGMTVNIFIRTIRLKVAARLLEQGKYNISEVAYSVGFNNPKYFSTCFSEMYKMSPKEYMK